jgi:acetyl esterase/lipase
MTFTLGVLLGGGKFGRFIESYAEPPKILSAAIQDQTEKKVYKDVSYANESPSQKFDLYLPKAGVGPYPLLIWIHGGGLIMGDKSSLPQTDFGPAPKPEGPYGPYQIQTPDLSELNHKGYAVISLNYRLGDSPVAAAETAIKDCKAAIRFLRANATTYKLEPKRFAVWGNSMGGYLAAMLGATGDRVTPFDSSDLSDVKISAAVQAVVVWYGAENRMPNDHRNLNDQISQAKSLPPYFIVNGDQDPVITQWQALRLHEALVKAGAKSKLVIVSGAGHEDPQIRTAQMTPTLEFIFQSLKNDE